MINSMRDCQSHFVETFTYRCASVVLPRLLFALGKPTLCVKPLAKTLDDARAPVVFCCHLQHSLWLVVSCWCAHDYSVNTDCVILDQIDGDIARVLRAFIVARAPTIILVCVAIAFISQAVLMA
jgi:hypothetical protein